MGLERPGWEPQVCGIPGRGWPRKTPGKPFLPLGKGNGVIIYQLRKENNLVWVELKFETD